MKCFECGVAVNYVVDAGETLELVLGGAGAAFHFGCH